MGRIGFLLSEGLDRRVFCNLIGGWAAGFALARRTFATEQTLQVTEIDQKFFVVNGWVLTRDDIGASG
jgi:hypothetical protein